MRRESGVAWWYVICKLKKSEEKSISLDSEVMLRNGSTSFKRLIKSPCSQGSSSRLRCRRSLFPCLHTFLLNFESFIWFG